MGVEEEGLVECGYRGGYLLGWIEVGLMACEANNN